MTWSITKRVSELKRQYSSSFSETPVRGRAAYSLTPVSKLIKEQQDRAKKVCLGDPERPTTPVEHENSLRRLSVQEEASPGLSLFKDTPAQGDSDAPIPFHAVTLQAGRLLAYPLASHQTLTCLLSDVLRSIVQPEVEAVQGIFRRALLWRGGRSNDQCSGSLYRLGAEAFQSSESHIYTRKLM